MDRHASYHTVQLPAQAPAQAPANSKTMLLATSCVVGAAALALVVASTTGVATQNYVAVQTKPAMSTRYVPTQQQRFGHMTQTQFATVPQSDTVVNEGIEVSPAFAATSGLNQVCCVGLHPSLLGCMHIVTVHGTVPLRERLLLFLLLVQGFGAWLLAPVLALAGMWFWKRQANQMVPLSNLDWSMATVAGPKPEEKKAEEIQMVSAGSQCPYHLLVPCVYGGTVESCLGAARVLCHSSVDTAILAPSFCFVPCFKSVPSASLLPATERRNSQERFAHSDRGVLCV